MTYKVTERDLEVVKALASTGVNTKLISQYIGIHEETLFKYYKEHMLKAKLDRNMVVAQSLYEKAVIDKNVVAMMFWLKTQAGWREIPRDDPANEEIKDVVGRLIEHLPD